VAISRASDSSIQDGLPKYNDIWDGTTATSAFDSLGAVVLATAASSITFSNIPATYTHLQIRGSARDSRATYPNSNLQIRFNGDTAANYSWHNLQGQGSTATGRGLSDTTAITSNTLAAAGAPSGTFSCYVIDILDYANTNKNKTLRSLGGVDANGLVAGEGGIVELLSGNWRNSVAITSISLTADTPNLLQYSTFALYGIK
jgi:hypothetical protein